MSADEDALRHDTARKAEPSALRRGLTPRKFAKLFDELPFPFYVVDGRDRVRYLNPALAHWLSVDANAILGSVCRLAEHDVSSGGQRLACLAIPSWARGESIAVYPLGDGTASTPWRLGLQVAIEGESLKGGAACFWLASGHALERYLETDPDWLEKSEIRGALMEFRNQSSKLELLPAWIGRSPLAHQTRRQCQSAIAANGPVLVIGGEGSGATDLAKAIYYQRRRRQQRLAAKGTMLPVECRLMDRLLMQEIIELANERDANEAQADTDPPSLLLIDLHLLPAEVHVLLADTLSRHPSRVHYATTSVIDLSRLYPESPSWQTIVAALDIARVSIPSLEHRPEDIAELTEYYLEQCRGEFPDLSPRAISQSGRQWLQAYPWPGNHRELFEALRFAYQRADRSIEPENFPVAIRTFSSHALAHEPPAPIDLDRALEEYEKQLLKQALDTFPRNRAAAARLLGISRTRLLRRLVQLGLAPATEPELRSMGTDKSPQPASTLPPLTKETEPAEDEPIFEEIPFVEDEEDR